MRFTHGLRLVTIYTFCLINYNAYGIKLQGLTVTLNTCADLYAFFHFELGEKAYFPDEAVKISDNRLFGMFHSSTPQHNKEVILQSLTQNDVIVRVVFATVALGMGVNIKDVNLIVHYGAPHSIDNYFQESGRGGRSGDCARSIVFWKPLDCPVKKEPTCLRDSLHVPY